MPIASAILITSIRSWRDEQYSSVIVVFPVLHEQADHLPALLLEQQRGHRGINTAGQADDHGFLKTSGPAPFFHSSSGRITAGCPLSTNQLSTTKRRGSSSCFSSITADQCTGTRPAKLRALRLQHAVPAQIPPPHQQVQQAGGGRRVIDAIHPARDMVVRVVAATIVVDIRLLAAPGVEAAQRLGQALALAGRIGGRAMIMRRIWPKLPLGIANRYA